MTHNNKHVMLVKKNWARCLGKGDIKNRKMIASAELNENGDMIGIEILNVGSIIRDAVMETRNSLAGIQHQVIPDFFVGNPVFSHSDSVFGTESRKVMQVSVDALSRYA